MKIIDLLNKIAKGEEVPEKIIYNNTLYSYKEGIDYENGFCNYLMSSSVCICPEDLNSEVEIIEEPKEHKIPEKINISKFPRHNNSLKKTAIKINEIIDYLKGK